jgi:hypothetical protein
MARLSRRGRERAGCLTALALVEGNLAPQRFAPCTCQFVQRVDLDIGQQTRRRIKHARIAVRVRCCE